MKSLLVILYFILFIGEIFATKSYPITTLLNAKWQTTPIYLEISEFLYDDSPNLYWDYVNELKSLPVPLYELGEYYPHSTHSLCKKRARKRLNFFFIYSIHR